MPVMLATNSRRNAHPTARGHAVTAGEKANCANIAREFFLQPPYMRLCRTSLIPIQRRWIWLTRLVVGGKKWEGQGSTRIGRGPLRYRSGAQHEHPHLPIHPVRGATQICLSLSSKRERFRPYSTRRIIRLQAMISSSRMACHIISLLPTPGRRDCR